MLPRSDGTCIPMAFVTKSFLVKLLKVRLTKKTDSDKEHQDYKADLIDTVAGYRRRRLLVEEVPGLYIRRLTLEDPRSPVREKEPTDSRSPSPRHICHPRSAHDRRGRGSSRSLSKTSAPLSRSYRSWLERVRNERPAYLTITSLELPESPIPLIESQASARLRAAEEFPRDNSGRDIILDEFLEKVSRIGRDKNTDLNGARSYRTSDTSRGAMTKRKGVHGDFAENQCNGELASLEECTKSISEGPSGHNIRPSTRQPDAFKDCICSEISENLRVNIREKTEVNRSSRSPSPEVTHTIRIAMKYHGKSEHNRTIQSGECANTRKRDDNRDATEMNGKDERHSGNKNFRFREDGCCPGVNLALDFTLNCNSVQLTSREINLRTGSTAIPKNNQIIE